ncbi:sialin-like [Babylonia areolata]|uniref:sialin-like n=1 Tax=Babylonia areolata TaxID=304850 RepID=UPI003FD53B8C
MSNTGGDKAQLNTAKVPTLCSQRWNLSLLAFFGFLSMYVARVNLSVAIICMVRIPDQNLSFVANGTAQPYLTISTVAGPLSERESGREAADGGMSGADGGTEEDSQCGGDLQQSLDVTQQDQTGEFNWDKSMRSRFLATYFYGYIVTQIPGGWLTGRYGGRKVWGICQLISSICSLLTPLAARTHVDLASALRFILGLASGVSFPCFQAMMGRWAPTLERSKLASLAFAGPPIATILTFSLSALLCSYGFDNGWGSVFYLSARKVVLWQLHYKFEIWNLLQGFHRRKLQLRNNCAMSECRSLPTGVCWRNHGLYDNCATSKNESFNLLYGSQMKIATPWREIFTSRPIWALLVAHVSYNYTNYTLLTSLPTFMKEVLKFDIKQNGGLSAVPYLCMAVLAVLAGQVADCLRARRILSTKATRKMFQTISFLGGAVCLVVVGYMPCTQRALAVFLLSLCLCFAALNRAGYAVNHIDLAPRHAGVLFGITNTAATIPGMIAPLVAGALTPNRTAEEWRTVFFVCAGVQVVGALIFGLLAEGHVQSWATPPEEEYDIEMIADHTAGKENTSVNGATEEKPL